MAGGIVLRASGAYAREGIHAYYFSAPGELILSTATETGVVRAMLTWKRRGDALHIEIQAAHLGG